MAESESEFEYSNSQSSDDHSGGLKLGIKFVVLCIRALHRIGFVVLV